MHTKISLSLALLLAGSTAVVAGTPLLAQQQQNPPQWRGQGPHTPPNPQQQAERLTKRLNLNPDQESRLEQIFADRDQKTLALRSDTSLSRDAKRQQMQTIMSSTHEQLSTVLTPEQLAQMHSHRRGHHRGAPGQQQTPSAS